MFSLNLLRLQLPFILIKMKLILVLAIKVLCLVMRLMSGILNHFTPTHTGFLTSFVRSLQHKDTQEKFHGYVLILNPKLSLSIKRRTMVSWLQFVFTTSWSQLNMILTFLRRLLSQPFTKRLWKRLFQNTSLLIQRLLLTHLANLFSEVLTLMQVLQAVRLLLILMVDGLPMVVVHSLVRIQLRSIDQLLTMLDMSPNQS
jgi:hypothetical protein